MHFYKTIIIGAGISGLSAAKLLAERGEEYVLLEGASKPGGLVKCDVVDGHLYHRVGGHVFNTRVQKVAGWFWEKFNRDEEFLKAQRNAVILMNNREIGYPLENHLYMLDDHLQEKILGEIRELERAGTRDPFSYDNFRDFLKGNFGEELYRLYFEPYNNKIWQTDLSMVALPWLEGKLPMPDYGEIIRSNKERKTETGMVHSTFFYPVRGGSQFIADRLAEGLDISYEYGVVSMERRKDSWIINDELTAETVIYTGDIRKLAAMIKGAGPGLSPALESLTGLRSNGTSNLLCKTDDTPLSWLYLPDKNIPAHRIIFTGNFSQGNDPKGGKRSCTVEFSGQTDLKIMKKTLLTLPFNLEYIADNYEPNSYVIQYHGDRERIGKARQLLQDQGFYLSGRFAEWEYYNMDKAMERAMKVVESIK
ncbi:MAG: protoporphyrinogen/coproporphyrinogen oxidase [Bacteroidota bacterium]